MPDDRKRSRVLRSDGRTINVVHQRGQLFVCSQGCCCGLVERGFAPVDTDLYHREWERRKLRNRVHLTQSGCLGPCPLANVALLLFDGRPVWFQAVDTDEMVLALFDYIEAMLAADRWLPPPALLDEHVFDYYAWDQAGAGPHPLAGASTPAEPEAILLLTHKDTDLLTLEAARALLPEGFPPVRAVNLLKIKTAADMIRLIAEDAAPAQLIVARVLGRPGDIPGFADLREHAAQEGKPLLIVSGTDAPDPEMAALSLADAGALAQVMAYFQADGAANLAHMLRYLADHTLLTGFGFAAPQAQPGHGLYHPALERPANLESWLAHHDPAKPTAGILFYRAHYLSGNLAFVDALIEAVEGRGLNALPIYTASLRDASPATIDGAQIDRWPEAFRFFERVRPDVLINTISFAMGEVNPHGPTLTTWAAEALYALDVPMLQAITGAGSEAAWRASARGLNPLETAMQVALPEFDGRIISVPVSFKPGGEAGEQVYAPLAERIERVAGMAARWAALRRKPNAQKRVAFILTNSSSKAARIGDAVGLDAPASLLRITQAMQAAGYHIEGLPASGDALLHQLIDAGSYDISGVLTLGVGADAPAARVGEGAYQGWYQALTARQQGRISARWGPPPGQGYFEGGHIHLAGLEFGNVFVAIQPPRGYNLDPDAIYHQPELAPPHYYHAFYRWLRDEWCADAIVHVGKHGTLEWLPGKGVGLSEECFPDTFLADLPLIYPFIINDPGEGAQAKRRTHAVIIDHLTPPMTTADAYGPLAELMQLVDEYYQVEKLDPTKLPALQNRIWALIQETHLESDLTAMLRRNHGDHVHEWDAQTTADGVPVSLAEMGGFEVAHLIEDIDGYLCELAGLQIRDGLHVLGQAPQAEDLIGLLMALTRLPNLDVPGMRQALAEFFGLDFDALLAAPGAAFDRRPDRLEAAARRAIYSHADALEAIDGLHRALLEGLGAAGFRAGAVERVLAGVLGGGRGAADALRASGADAPGVRSTPAAPVPRLAAALRFVCSDLAPLLARTGEEVEHLLRALAGGFVPAGPSGAPTRGMAHVLPTGRNFYAVDPRALPSAAAWEVGQRLAAQVMARYLAEAGEHPRSVALSLWGTSAMRTYGDDVAQALALLGVRPVWQAQNRRITGLEAVPLAELGRPRVDVTLRISGFFRDAFPHLVKLLDEAASLVINLDEPPEMNAPRAHYLAELAQHIEAGLPKAEADRQARLRVFGSGPGAYGAGLLPLIEQGNWGDLADLAEVYVSWGGHAYTADALEGFEAKDAFRARLAGVQLALHNQDNREHDILDSDDYFQFHGGLIAAITALRGDKPRHYFGDSSDPARAKVRDLKEELLRVYRARAVNPKWLAGIMEHGYKGALEMLATVDYLFGYSATTGLVEDFMYEGVAQAYALDAGVQAFLEESNPWALEAISGRLLEAAQRGLWQAPSPQTLASLEQAYMQAETWIEGRAKPGGSAGGEGL